MTKLVSMARTKAEKKGEAKAAVNPMPDMPDFPWGLEVRLDGDSLKKLGRTVDDFAYDTVVDLVCKARVKGVNTSSCPSGESGSVELQIESLRVNTPEDKTAKAVREVYGRGK